MPPRPCSVPAKQQQRTPSAAGTMIERKSYDLSTGAVDSVYTGEVVTRRYIFESNGGGSQGIPFTASDLVVVNPSGGFWHAKTASYRLTRTDCRTPNPYWKGCWWTTRGGSGWKGPPRTTFPHLTVGERLPTVADEDQRTRSVVQRPRLVENLRRPTTQGHPVLALRLHAGLRNRPHALHPVDLRPLGPPHLAPPRCREHEELNGQFRMCRTTASCGPRTGPTRSAGLSGLYSIATAHSSTVRIRWCTTRPVRALAGQLAVGPRLLAGLGERNQADASEPEVAASPADNEALYPAPGSARLDVGVELRRAPWPGSVPHRLAVRASVQLSRFDLQMPRDLGLRHPLLEIMSQEHPLLSPDHCASSVQWRRKIAESAPEHPPTSGPTPYRFQPSGPEVCRFGRPHLCRFGRPVTADTPGWPQRRRTTILNRLPNVTERGHAHPTFTRFCPNLHPVPLSRPVL